MTITNGYTTLNDVKAALRIVDSADDALIELAIETASRDIDGYCNRTFYNAGTAARYFAAQDELVCQVDDLAGTAITLQTDQNADGNFALTWTPSNYQLEPLNGYSNGQVWPYTRIRASLNYLFPVTNDLALVKVTGVWGWPSIPTAIKYACTIQAQRLFKRYDSPLGIIGFGDMGGIRVGSRLDPDVALAVDPYRKMDGVS